MHTIFRGAGAAGRQFSKKAAETVVNPVKRGFKTLPKQNAKTKAELEYDFSFAHKGPSDSFGEMRSPLTPESPMPKARRDSKQNRKGKDTVKKNLLDMFNAEAENPCTKFDTALAEMKYSGKSFNTSSLGNKFSMNVVAREIIRSDSPVCFQQSASINTSASSKTAALLEGGSFGVIANQQNTTKDIIKHAVENSPINSSLAAAAQEARSMLGHEPSKAQILKSLFFGAEVLGSPAALNVGAHNVLVEGKGPIGALLRAVKQARGGSDDVNITVMQKEAGLKLLGAAGQGFADGFSVLAKLIGAALITTAAAEGTIEDNPEQEVQIELDKLAKDITVTHNKKGITIKANEEVLKALETAAHAANQKIIEAVDASNAASSNHSGESAPEADVKVKPIGEIVQNDRFADLVMKLGCF